MPEVILISGKARHGKDTAARVLKRCALMNNKTALIIRYADILKYVCKEYFGWNGKKDSKGRTLLQQVGTELVRVNNPDAWVNCVIELVKGFGNKFDYILIPDTRFPNEIEAWKDTGFKYTSLRVDRYNEDMTLFDNGLTEEQKNHLSEIALDNYKFDFKICNTDISKFTKDLEYFFNELEDNE